MKRVIVSIRRCRQRLFFGEISDANGSLPRRSTDDDDPHDPENLDVEARRRSRNRNGVKPVDSLEIFGQPILRPSGGGDAPRMGGKRRDLRRLFPLFERMSQLPPNRPDRRYRGRQNAGPLRDLVEGTARGTEARRDVRGARKDDGRPDDLRGRVRGGKGRRFGVVEINLALREKTARKNVTGRQRQCPSPCKFGTDRTNARTTRYIKEALATLSCCLAIWGGAAVFGGGSKLWTNFESIRDSDDDYFCFRKQCHTCEHLVRLVNLNDDKTLVPYETWWKEQQEERRHAETRAPQ